MEHGGRSKRRLEKGWEGGGARPTPCPGKHGMRRWGKNKKKSGGGGTEGYVKEKGSPAAAVMRSMHRRAPPPPMLRLALAALHVIVHLRTF